MERKNREKYEFEKKDREKKEYERKDRERKELERKQLEKKELERKIREMRQRDPKPADEKSRLAPRSSAPPKQPAHWIQPDGTLKPFKEIHKMSQWSEEGSTEVYVSCLGCQKTIKGAESYSLWAHVESKRCYLENAIKGWRQQAKEKEQQAKINEAYRTIAKEAARKMPKLRGQTLVPSIYPARERRVTPKYY